MLQVQGLKLDGVIIFLIEIESALYLFLVRVRAATGISSERLRIYDKPCE